MVENYHPSLDETKAPMQKSGAETDRPSSKSSQTAAVGESIADSVRNFLEIRQATIPDDTGVVFDNISAVGSGTGVSTTDSIEGITVNG